MVNEWWLELNNRLDFFYDKLIDIFLSNRNKEKYIFYNFTPAFQINGILKNTPDIYIKSHPKCTIDLTLSMHRQFTDEEKQNFDKDYCLGNESVNFIFGIKCLPLQPNKALISSKM